MVGDSGYVYEVFGSFQGEGPLVGQRHLFLRLCCCNLSCAYCDTADARQKRPAAFIDRAPGRPGKILPNPVAVPAVVNALSLLDTPAGLYDALCVTGGEPLEQPEFLAGVLSGLGGRLKVLLETNGTLPDAYAVAGGLVDFVSMDVKLPSAYGGRGLWKRHESFMAAAKDKLVAVKTVVSDATPKSELARAARLVAKTAPDAMLVIQPMTKRGRPALDGAGLERLYAAARRQHGNVRVIPQMHRFLKVR